MGQEDELIQWLREQSPMGELIRTGIGDDSAVVEPTDESQVLTTDMVIEGIHFEGDTDPWHVGWKAAARAVSDLAAMAARPLYLLATVAIPRSAQHQRRESRSKPCSRESIGVREHRLEKDSPGSGFDGNPIFGGAAMRGGRLWGSQPTPAAFRSKSAPKKVTKESPSGWRRRARRPWTRWESYDKKKKTDKQAKNAKI